ncbi:MAG TPA: RNA polymerase sigma factor [Candidatus Limnocylindrales bacterium]|nr:RNA polymerase sigma factor [Candidatus Limnocylindrales bacterium]
MDRELVILAREGDHDAFARLVASSIGRLNAIARLILRDYGLAEDAVQDAFVDAWRSLPGLRDPDRFDAWMTTLLVRTCQDARRRARRRAVELPLLANDDPEIADHHAAFAVTDQLERGLRDLTVDQRTVIVLSFYLDLPIAEAASVLGIPAGTMKSRLHRALTALRATVDADDRPIARTAERTT